MSILKVDMAVIDFLITELFNKNHICIIGGSKCAKSKLADAMIKKIISDKKYKVEKTNDDIPGIAYSFTYIIDGLDKPLTYLKNVSGLSLLHLEKLYKENYLITTFPVTSLDILFNRFISFNEDYRLIKNFYERIWGCIPVIAENKVLGNGCAYMVHYFELVYSNGIINKQSLCRFKKDKNIFEEDFSSVHGKYVFSSTDLS